MFSAPGPRTPSWDLHYVVGTGWSNLAHAIKQNTDGYHQNHINKNEKFILIFPDIGSNMKFTLGQL